MAYWPRYALRRLFACQGFVNERLYSIFGWYGRAALNLFVLMEWSCITLSIRGLLTLETTIFFVFSTRNILPTENNFVNIASFGDGYHNYHHVFPWDYRNSESWDYKLNFSTLFIDAFAKIGWAYDLKTVQDKMIAARVKRTGDGSHPVWGWDDKTMTKAEKDLAEIRRPETEERARGWGGKKT